MTDIRFTLPTGAFLTHTPFGGGTFVVAVLDLYVEHLQRTVQLRFCGEEQEIEETVDRSGVG